MKRIILIIFLLPLLVQAQKIRVNELDKFIRQKRIETFPLPILSAAKNKMAVTLSSVGAALYIQLSGAGIGANRIEENDRVIFLFENDSTATIYSKGYQTFDIGMNVNSYTHSYKLTLDDLLKLSQYQVEALRKYHAEEFDDIYITAEASAKFKELSVLFLSELAKEKLVPTAQDIVVRDIANHTGDSVTFVARIAGSRYLFESKDATTLLDVGNPSPNAFVTVVIRSEDKKAVGDYPQNYYNGKMARISGRVATMNGKPHMVVTKKEQLVLLQDTTATAANRPVQTVAPPPTAPPVADKPVAYAPAFPGGYEVWMDFLNRNLKAPVELKNGEKKTVIVQFLVGADGSISNIQIVQSAGADFDKEVLRVLGRMPKWKAAIENGRPASSVVTQPVTFYGVQTQPKAPF